MSRPLLAIPHRVEAFAGGCLPACLQMALAFFGLDWPQERIASQIGHITGAGTPARNVVRLSAPGIRVSYVAQGTLAQVEQSLAEGAVPILFVRTGELPHWEEDTAHALVIVGIENDVIIIHDPAFEHAPIPVPIDDFSLAWYEFGNQWAMVARKA